MDYLALDYSIIPEPVREPLRKFVISGWENAANDGTGDALGKACERRMTKFEKEHDDELAQKWAGAKDAVRGICMRHSSSNEFKSAVDAVIIAANSEYANAAIKKSGPGQMAAITLPPLADIISAASRGEITPEQSVRKFCDWYADYFTKVFRTYTREMVGKKISPGDWHMGKAISLMQSGAAELPPNERMQCFIPLDILLQGIADAWPDATAHAMSAKYHLGEMRDFMGHKVDTCEECDRAQKSVDEFNEHCAELKKELNKLSVVLLDAGKTNFDTLQETLACMGKQLTDIGRDAKTAAEQSTIAAQGKRIYAGNEGKGKGVRGVDKLPKGDAKKQRFPGDAGALVILRLGAYLVCPEYYECPIDQEDGDKIKKRMRKANLSEAIQAIYWWHRTEFRERMTQRYNRHRDSSSLTIEDRLTCFRTWAQYLQRYMRNEPKTTQHRHIKNGK